MTDPPVTDPPVTDPPVTDPPVTHVEPVLTVERHINYEELDGDGAVFFTVELNDLEGGSATARLYRKTSSGWEALSGAGTSATKTFAEGEDYWDNNDFGSSDLMWYSPPRNGDIGAKDTVKLVIEYTYPDGTTGTLESDPLPFHSGDFAEPDWDFGNEGWEYLYTNNNLIFDVIIRDDLVTPGSVSVQRTELWDDDSSTEISATPTVTTNQGSDGKTHMVFTYHFSEVLHEGNFYFWALLCYPEDSANNWYSGAEVYFAL